ncbi:MAG TPA: nuclear transport factor 2 family protein [Chloroflexota bacterium]|nr:nuclear transport factor 2 family protein [Chloroflexota bacterium]
MPIQPEDIHQLFAEGVNAGDVDALVTLFETDATVIEQTGERTEGCDRIRTHLEHLVALRPVMRIEASVAHRQGDLALLSSRWTASATTPDGKPVEMEFHGSEIARLQSDGNWRLMLDNPWGAG